MSVDTFTLSGLEAAVILRVFDWYDASREALAQAAQTNPLTPLASLA